MRSTPESSTSPQPNGFSAAYLDRARHVDEPPFLKEARFAGPWTVEEVVASHGGTVYAVSRQAEPVAQGGGGAAAVFKTQADAQVAAAAFAALAVPNHLSLNTQGRTPSARRRLGYPLHDGTEHIGHLSRPDAELLPYLHAVRSLVANPEAMGTAIAALGGEVSALVGRALMRRME